MLSRRTLSGTSVALGFVVLSCLDPTQVTLEITTDAVCADLDSTDIVVGRLEELKGTAPSASTPNCDESGRIGDIVLVPQRKKNSAVAFEVVTGIRTATSRCAEMNYEGCIVARRALGFVPRRPLELPIELEIECLDVPCGATETCRNGACVSATLENPESCTDPAGCDDGGVSSPDEQGPTGSGGMLTSSGGSTGGGGLTSGGTSSGGVSSGGAPMSSGGMSVGGMGGEAPVLRQGGPHLAVVTTSADVLDGAVTSLTALANDPGADGRVSLREALIAANATDNEDTVDVIEFAIPEEGPHTIIVQEAGLPLIVDKVVVDGRTQQPGAFHIALDGSLTTSAAGLELDAGSSQSEIYGLVIHSFAGAGIYAHNSASHRVQRCLIGVGLDGVTKKGNLDGIHLHQSPGNVIGGSAFAGGGEGNVISGNDRRGLMLTGASSTGNVIQGNYIGLAHDGSTAAGNGEPGVEIKDGAGDNIVGGSSDLKLGNVISANGTHGVRIVGRSGGSHDNRIQGNFIGTDRVYSAKNTLGNGQSGVRILRDARRNLVGGPNPGDGNRIAFNGASGVRIGEGTTLPIDTSVLGNWITDNGELGIELFDGDPDFVTLNDDGDTDGGTNGTQNYPVITQTSYAGGSVTVDYELDSLAGDYRIEFFSSTSMDNICAVNPLSPPNCLTDVAGDHFHGEGHIFLHFQEITVSGTGPEAFQTSFAMPEEEFVSATATQAHFGPTTTYAATSEFSRIVPTTF